ncbi:hypothetical protein RIF29_15844 [Crotalaria pallida]|uniref:WRKY domain-containing protein n=1 Tax=Crotalaria pallida TaxID=3830 RepID=A0AAN9FG61_CROPI
MEDHNNILESKGDEETGSNKDQKLELAKGEMGEVREENERLKFLLARLVKDYESLQTNFLEILQQDRKEEATKPTCTTTTTTINEESDTISLSLGIMSSSKGQPTMDEKKNSTRIGKRELDDDEDYLHKGLALGLDIKFDPTSSPAEGDVTNNNSAQSSFDNEEGKEEEPIEMWPPSKVLKTMKTEDKSENSQQTQLKKTRVSIRARCDTQTVQRCAEDMSILITTYEGTHNHPLPISATAMASTTSAAASMLQSPSLTSQQPNAEITPNSSALNFSTYQISRPHQFYFPKSSITTLNSHPTITLDLTAPPTTSSCFSYIPKYSSSSSITNLSFSSGYSPLQSSMPQYSSSLSTWSNNYSGNCFNNNGTLTQNRNQGGGGYVINNYGKQSLLFHQGNNNLHQPIYMMSNHNNNIPQQQSLPDSIVAATNAITTNQKFQSALATALTTYVGNGGKVRENDIAESATLNLKLSGGDVSSSLNNDGEQGNLVTFSKSLAGSKSATSLSSNRSNQL